MAANDMGIDINLPKRCVVYSKTKGVYLGMGFWSHANTMTAKHVGSAPTYPAAKPLTETVSLNEVPDAEYREVIPDLGGGNIRLDTLATNHDLR